MRFAIAIILTIHCSHAWTLKNGTVFEADLAAADGLRASFTKAGKSPVVMPLADLTAEDAQAIRKWRVDRRHPLVIPSRLAAWPPRATAAAEIKEMNSKAGTSIHRSPNFIITSDLRLPLSAIHDIAKVLEGTRTALIAIPLGLHAGGESEPYPVHLFRDANGYGRAGGANGSGGHYDGRSGRMLVFLPNIGITEKDGRTVLDYTKNLFVLKHEVTHQLMDRWHGRMPMWVSEGIAEFIASLPYAQGNYTLQNPGAGMRDYLLKWQMGSPGKSIRLIPPTRLMSLDRDDWEAAVSQQVAYDQYNSAALLTYYFIQKNNGTPLAGYLDALRRGIRSDEAERIHLLDGKDRTFLDQEIQKLCEKIGVKTEEF
jgi:hypothetical protein